jgi:hypothetical protein
VVVAEVHPPWPLDLVDWGAARVNPYLTLTREFNRGALRAIVSSGQAVVLHRLAVSSKDGDWIVREDPEALTHVLEVLARHGARYRFGAPLDVRWMCGGWSSHLEWRAGDVRLRTDFVTRPARLDTRDLAALWREQAQAELPFVDARRLVEIKKTDRERDYAFIGELARLLTTPRDQLLASRSARDLLALARAHAALARELVGERALLREALAGEVRALEVALDAERRELMQANARRLESYERAAAAWAGAWPALDREISRLPLAEAHRRMLARAEALLPVAAEAIRS